MKIILKDLGKILKGSSERLRHYYLLQCTQCKKEFEAREDDLRLSTPCKSCIRKNNTQQKVSKILVENLKICAHCKKELPLSSFGKRSNSSTGFRHSCKECEKKVSKDSQLLYRKRDNVKVRKKVYDSNYCTKPEVKKRKNLQAKQWALNNKEKRKAISDNDRHKRRAAKGNTLSTKEFTVWLSTEILICAYCGISCKTSYTIDHIEPLSKGGTHVTNNLTIACSSCNFSKHNTTLIVWLAKR